MISILWKLAFRVEVDEVDRCRLRIKEIQLNCEHQHQAEKNAEPLNP